MLKFKSTFDGISWREITISAYGETIAVIEEQWLPQPSSLQFMINSASLGIDAGSFSSSSRKFASADLAKEFIQEFYAKNPREVLEGVLAIKHNALALKTLAVQRAIKAEQQAADDVHNIECLIGSL